MPKQDLQRAQIGSSVEKIGGKGMAQRVGCCAFGQAKIGAHAFELELNKPGAQGPAACTAKEQRPFGQIMRALLLVEFAKPGNNRKNGHFTLF